MTVYGDLDQVKKMLRPNTSTTFDADVDARLAAIQYAVSVAIDNKLGRSFGLPVSDTTHLVFAGRSSLLILPTPARVITSVTMGGTVAGSTMTGGTALDSAEWVYDPVDRDTGLIFGLRLLSGGNWGTVDVYNRPITPVKIIGDFATSDEDAVIPEEIGYIADYLTAETFKAENASASGSIGLEGEFVAPRNPWNDMLVKEILDKYRTLAEVAI